MYREFNLYFETEGDRVLKHRKVMGQGQRSEGIDFEAAYHFKNQRRI